MLINKKLSSDLTDNDVTDFKLYQKRRDFIKSMGAFALLSASGVPLTAQANNGFRTDEKITDYEDAITYNNFYEFGTSKSAPVANSQDFVTSPWTVKVDGACEKPGTYNLEDLMKTQTVEERIYRLRCVEGWSMVLPWQGIELGKLIKRFQPTSKAKYIRFETLYDPKQMPGQRRAVLDWPYVEGLRMDEAMNPLTILGTGLYGKDLLNQNGAPLRLVVPWKYGFKSIKSIVRISFVEKQPLSSWKKSASNEYGFFANVNPDVSHPRWSQRRERRIGEFRKRKTEMFNGYAEQVASLYSGMDLRKHF